MGYRPLGVNQEKEYSVVRTIGNNNFPRFHIYLRKSEKTGQFEINLHLDQKKPSYRGTAAHAGEYEGKIIEEEAERIKKIF